MISAPNSPLPSDIIIPSRPLLRLHFKYVSGNPKPAIPFNHTIKGNIDKKDDRLIVCYV